MQHFASSFRRHGWHMLGLTVVCVIGFIIRWPAVYFALPYTPHPDEPYVINMVLKMLATGSLFPASFDRPHLSVYPVWLAVWLDTLRNPIPQELLLLPTDRISSVIAPFVVGRITSILMALLAIPLLVIHLAQKNLLRWGWLAAVWLCFLPFHVAQSGYIAPDGLVGVLTIATLVVTWQYTQTPTAHWWWIVALTVGLAIGTKYNLAAIAIVPAATQWHLVQARRWRPLLVALSVLAAGCMVGLFVTTPGLLVNGQQFIADMNAQVSHYSRHDAGNAPWAWQLYVAFFWGEGWPFLATPLVLLGMFLITKKGTPLERAILLFLAIELIFFLSRERHYMRNVMPLVIYAPIAMAVAAEWLWVRLPARRFLPVVLGLLLVIPILVQTVQVHRILEQPYNRLQVDTTVTAVGRGAVHVCTLDVTNVALTPSCAAASNKTSELSRWQQAGMQTLVVNRSQWPDYVVPDGMSLHTQYAKTAHGGNGEAFAVYTQNAATSLQVIGTPAQTSDGLRIAGVRIGLGLERTRPTPLYADASLQSRANPVALQVNGYVTVTAPVTEPGWWLFVHVLDANGTQIAQRVTLPRADYPISEWKKGELVVLPADVPLTTPLAPGNYTLEWGFYRPTDGARMVIDGGVDGGWRTSIKIRP